MGTALSECAGADVCPQQWLCPPTFSCFTFRRKVIPIIQSLNLSLEDSRDPWVQGPVGAVAELEAHPQCKRGVYSGVCSLLQTVPEPPKLQARAAAVRLPSGKW